MSDDTWTYGIVNWELEVLESEEVLFVLEIDSCHHFFGGNLSYEARSHSISPHHINCGYMQVTHGKTPNKSSETGVSPSARSYKVNSTLKYVPDQYHLVLYRNI